MKPLLFLLLLINVSSCKRYYAEQTVLPASLAHDCVIFTDVWDRYGSDDNHIQFFTTIPCAEANDSNRAADFKKAQQIADQLNK